ncbi:unnamed protein product [Acanthoscelides obtectus]|uniref:Uncharacterized protein n=1 Tax=Acanthoscelides obtectus TaxID=200917 RepID=A0A9P0PN71_ACAOB|nr:unnamed protein product [Acanthoscelides obtectus]CAK1620886.1 hypothetical protein AOBTE_LOCUS634 [Acanthoscelides obtectus]
MMDFKIILISVLSLATVHAVVPEMSVRSSSVPNAKYEVDAVEVLREAYSTYPGDTYHIARTISDVFETIHPSSGGWKVFFGCNQWEYYNARNFIYIAINVKIDNVTTVVTIFN